jgi:hypothetical protein
LLKAVYNLSFGFRLLSYIYLKEIREQELPIDEKSQIDVLIIQCFDIGKIKEKYQDAYELFKNEINFDKFKPTMAFGMFFKTKDGIFFINRNYLVTVFYQIRFLILHSKNLKIFLLMIGKIRIAKSDLNTHKVLLIVEIL